MAKVKVQQSTSPKFYIIIIAIIIVAIPILTSKIKMFDENGNSSNNSVSNSGQVQIILSKDYNLITFEEWRQIADYRAQEFSECLKGVEWSDDYKHESCRISYNNNWVEFRNAIEEKANLSSEEQEKLKDYWHKTREEVTEKAIGLMKENDKKKRPNYYQNN